MYAFRGDSIVLTSIGSLASVEIEARAVLLGPKGKPDEVSTGVITAQSDRTTGTVQSSQRFKHDGEIISAYVRVVSGSPVRGQLFVVLRIRKEAELCRGYLTTEQGVNLGQYEDSLSGRGLMRSIDLGDPAAGANYTAQTVPDNVSWAAVGISGQLITAANAGNRQFEIEVATGGARLALAGIAQHTQIQSVTREYLGGPDSAAGRIDIQAGGGGVPAALTWIPVAMSGLVLPAGFTYTFRTQGIFAGDNWGDGQMLVEEWLVA